MNIRMMVTVKGKVQGVNFRHYTREQALIFGVTGWVRNLPDGSVQGCFEGNERDVRALVDWCRSGPSWARVDAVQAEHADFSGKFDDFRICPD